MLAEMEMEPQTTPWIRFFWIPNRESRAQDFEERLSARIVDKNELSGA